MAYKMPFLEGLSPAYRITVDKSGKMGSIL